LIAALRQEQLDNELFDSVAIIIDALLDEGPVKGISEYEHAEETLTLYLNHAKKHATTLKHLWHVLNVQSWCKYRKPEYKTFLLAQCAEIISDPAWRSKIITAIEREEMPYTVNVATRMDIDISDMLLPLVKQKPLEYCYYAEMFFENPSLAAELIELYESILPLEDMAEGMGDQLFSKNLSKEHGCLDYLLPLLTSRVMLGVKLIMAGLNSRVVRERNMACNALSGWVKKQGRPLADISPELHSEITQIYEIEVNEQTKETMKKLIDGEIAEE